MPKLGSYPLWLVRPVLWLRLKGSWSKTDSTDDVFLQKVKVKVKVKVLWLRLKGSWCKTHWFNSWVWIWIWLTCKSPPNGSLFGADQVFLGDEGGRPGGSFEGPESFREPWSRASWGRRMFSAAQWLDCFFQCSMFNVQWLDCECFSNV